MIQLHGNSVWSNATPNSGKRVFTVDKEKTEDFVRLLEEGKFNYCYYQKNNTVTFALSKNDEERLLQIPLFKTVSIGNSDKNKSVTDIIGNTEYRNIHNRFFQKFQDKDFALRCAYELQKRNIPFSGRVYNNSVTLTVDKNNEPVLKELVNDIPLQIHNFAEKTENIIHLEWLLAEYFSNKQKETIIRNLINLSYQKPVGYSEKLTFNLDNEFVKQYSPQDLDAFSEVFNRCYGDLSADELLFPKASHTEELTKFLTQKEQEYTCYAMTDGKGFSNEQRQALQLLFYDNVPLSVTGVLDYEFGSSDILKIRELWQAEDREKSFVPELSKLIAEVKHQPLAEIDKQLYYGNYQAKQVFSKEDYQIQDYSFTEKFNMYRIPLQINDGMINKLTDNHIDSSVDIDESYSAVLFADGRNYHQIWIYNTDGYFVQEFNTKDVFNEQEREIFSDVLTEVQTLEIEKEIFTEFAVKKCSENNLVQQLYANFSYDNFEVEVHNLITNLVTDVISNAVIGKSIIPEMIPEQATHFVNHYYVNDNTKQDIAENVTKQVHNILNEKITLTESTQNNDSIEDITETEDFLSFEQQHTELLKSKAKTHIEQQKAKIDSLSKNEDENYAEIQNIYESIIPIAKKYQIELSVVDDYRYFLENRYSNEKISNTPENEDVYTDEFSRNIDDIVDEEIFDEELPEEISEKGIEEMNTFPVETFVEQLPEETITAPTETSIEQPSEQATPTETSIEQPSEQAEISSEKNPEEQIQRHFHSINDLKIGDKFLYQNKEYTVTTFDGIYPNDIGVSYTEKMSGGITYQLTSNIDWRELVTNGKYIEPVENHLENQSEQPKTNTLQTNKTEKVVDDKTPKEIKQSDSLVNTDNETVETIMEESSEKELSQPPEKEQNKPVTETQPNYSAIIGKNIILDTQDGFEQVIVSNINPEKNTATVLNNNDIFPISYEIPLSEVLTQFSEMETSVKTEDNGTITQDISNTEKITATDFHITDENIGAGTKGERFTNNLNAIKLLKQLESENRQATPDEQQILSRYVGWGGLSEYFKETNPHYQELKSLLTDDEYRSARSSTLDAFYTSPVIIDSIYQFLEKSGFNGGNVLEPSMGIGNFFGRMPLEIKNNSHLYGVEIDSITGRMAQHLYPNAHIDIKGFEKTAFNSDSFDVIVGNVPFGDLGFNDNVYGTNKIHDYFFLHSLDKVKDGGIVAFITSKGTLDKKDSFFREKISKQATLLGAVRLPNTAMKTAGTEVTADIIFLQKTSQPPEKEQSWINIGVNEDGLPINQYFVDNPDMVLGKVVEGNKLYGRGNDDTMCIPFENGDDLSVLLPKAFENIHAEIHTKKTELSPVQSDLPSENGNQTHIPDNLKNYDFFEDKNNIYMFVNRSAICLNREWKSNYNQTNIDRAKLYIAIRDTVRELLHIQQQDTSDIDMQIRQLQNKLNTQYNEFYKKYGLINSKFNNRLFRQDTSYPLMSSLENKYDLQNNQLIEKSDIFTKRTIKPHKIVESVDTPQEALALSVAERGRIDIDFMCHLTNMPSEEIIGDLLGKKEIFPVPELSDDEEIVYQTASEYLSGDIYEKLDVARISAKSNAIFFDNISALEEVMPPPLKAGDIDIECGATWIPPEIYRQFMYETFKTPDDNRVDRKSHFWSKKSKIDVAYSSMTNKWNISNKTADRSLEVSKVFGTQKRNAYTIFEDVLNLHIPNVTKKVPDPSNPSKDISVTDIEATKLVQKKAEKIKQDFKDWIFKDPERRQTLVDIYNRQFNCIRPREYDGTNLTFAGMTSSIELKQHQKNAIAHAIYGDNTLFAHCVGAGKTFEMIATAMESKRLGLCNKSLFAVPNHLTEQVGADFMKLYPSANILVATKKDFQTQNRRKLLSKIATGNYDAVIIGHSQLGMIPLSPERQEKLIRQQIEEITQGIQELKAQDGSRFQIKQMEKTRKSLQKKLETLTSSKKDDMLYFEELGVDKLFVDEAHEFKNLMSFTKLQNVAGISGRSSQKATDLFLKCRYLDEKTGGKGVVFATGTPVSNSVTELHTMMRYLEYDTLCRHGMQNFDNWVSIFGKQKTDYELAPTGDKFKIKTRIASYSNMPELMAMFKQCADVKTADMLNLPVPECEMHIVNVEATDLQKDMVTELSDRADQVNERNIDPREDNMLKITSDGRKVGLDPRLIDPSLEDNENTKLNQCVRNVFDIYKSTEKDKLTQIIFCDLGVPKPNSDSPQNTENENDEQRSVAELDAIEECTTFCVYDDIRNKLIDLGVQPSEIAFIHNAKTETQKSEMFDKVRSGEIRVLLGSTAKMGTGTNVQDKLIALHDLDVPWRPADLEQRRGRMVRQGNQNKKVHLYRYVTKGTFDAYSYQLLEKKQQFISQIITSKSPSRTCKDVDQEALTYAEIKALCTGDERIKEKLSLENRLQELRTFKKEYTDTRYEMEDKVRAYPKIREGLVARIKNIEKDIEHCKTIPFGENGLPVFSIKLNGKTFTDYKEASDELKLCCSRISPVRDKPVEIGEIYGFKLQLHYNHMEHCVTAVVKGNQEYSCNLGMYSLANIKKIEQLVTVSIQKECILSKSKLEKLDKDIVSAKEILQKPFEFEQELSDKEKRLSELTTQLTAEAIKKQKSKTTAGNDVFKRQYFGKSGVLAMGKSLAQKVQPSKSPQHNKNNTIE